MDSLNPKWLSIELDSIDTTVENWSGAVRLSYQAAVKALAEQNTRLHALIDVVDYDPIEN